MTEANAAGAQLTDQSPLLQVRSAAPEQKSQDVLKIPGFINAVVSAKSGLDVYQLIAFSSKNMFTEVPSDKRGLNNDIAPPDSPPYYYNIYYILHACFRLLSIFLIQAFIVPAAIVASLQAKPLTCLAKGSFELRVSAALLGVFLGVRMSRRVEELRQTGLYQTFTIQEAALKKQGFFQTGQLLRYGFLKIGVVVHLVMEVLVFIGGVLTIYSSTTVVAMLLGTLGFTFISGLDSAVIFSKDYNKMYKVLKAIGKHPNYEFARNRKNTMGVGSFDGKNVWKKMIKTLAVFLLYASMLVAIAMGVCY